MNADVVSGSGNITLDAANDLSVNAAVSTAGSGTVYLVAGNDVAVNDSVTTVAGDILVDATSNLTQDALITSGSGDVGLIAGGSLDQTSNGDINTGSDVLLEAGNAWTMAGDAVISATGNVVGHVLSGDATLGLINASNVGLTVSGSIVDGNDGSLNVSSTTLSLVSENGLVGGPDSLNGNSDENVNALDIAVESLAASSDSGIYISEADDLTLSLIHI